MTDAQSAIPPHTLPRIRQLATVLRVKKSLFFRKRGATVQRIGVCAWGETTYADCKFCVGGQKIIFLRFICPFLLAFLRSPASRVGSPPAGGGGIRCSGAIRLVVSGVVGGCDFALLTLSRQRSGRNRQRWGSRWNDAGLTIIATHNSVRAPCCMCSERG